MMADRSKRFPWLGHLVVFCLIGAFSMSPVIWLAVVNAQSSGAQIGLTDLMAQWGILGWLVTTPFVIGPFLFLVWGAIAAIHLALHLRRRGQA
ncbi:hypothetical protein SAMN06295905_3269 [Devosia lucknowensis]|uniref:Uncharacterized protein n=1 Tax=Devosia lucknowensis TaxID=1096929 RepID=A0A1Y6G9C3_9HYPH|nr:hypothetical protein [Devosia lucknowensis]SMQ85973.1 hypothetical protein SAMN06295905_3269 [Devosia lucknowensis]